MNLLRFLTHRFRKPLLVAIFISLLSGAANTLLVALISQRLAKLETISPIFLTTFALVLLMALMSDLLAKRLLISLTASTSGVLRISLSRQILQKHYEVIERIGQSRLQALLTDDISTISQAMGALPSIAVALATSLGCIGYLGWISPTTLLGLIVAAIPAVAGYRLLHRKAVRQSRLVLKTRNQLFSYYRSLIEGSKELLLHEARRSTFLDGLLQPTVQELIQQQTLARTWHQAAQSWSQSIYFFFILLLFMGAGFAHLEPGVIATYAIVALYLKSSVLTVLQMLTFWSDAEVALTQVESLGFTLDSSSDGRQMATVTPGVFANKEQQIQLALTNISYLYAQEEQSSFSLGPLDLTLDSGELVFIVGGNGSGKTTLIKLLTGLYTPRTGEITWNGKPVVAQNLRQYQQNFSVIFADFFLFDQLLGIEEWEIDQRAEFYLRQLQLDNKVKIEGNRLSTTNLSHGQRKRLALLTAYLEDRPVYIFDEWAASQDPEFREVFYRQLLPELKQRGKLVIVISHDDHYFDVADRVIELDFGKIVEQ